MNNAPIIQQIEFTGDDFETAEKIAKSLGYTQTAYTSSSALWGLFCIRDNNEMKEGCVIKTEQFGFMFVQTDEDLNLGYGYGIED